jgi:solute carrier family 25 folate transporter 32
VGWKENDTMMYASSAALAGSFCNLMTNPLWVIRTRMQAEIFLNPSLEHFNKKYSHGPLSVFKNMYEIGKNEGPKALYKGFSATMIGIIHPIVFFPLYEKLKIYCKQNYDQDSENLSTKYIVACTITSKLIASAISYPHEVLRSRM